MQSTKKDRAKEEKMGMRSKLVAVVAFVAFIVVAACAPAAPPPTPTSAPPPAATKAAPAGEPTKPAKVETIRLGVIGGNLAIYLPYYVADAKGFWERESIKPDVKEFPLSATVAQVLVAKEIDFASTSPEVIIAAVQKGEKLTIVTSDIDSMPYTLVTRPEIKAWEELKGKRIGVANVKSGSTPQLLKLLAAKGLKKGDYELITAGATRERYAALTAGGIAAALLAQPADVIAVDEGFRALGMTTDATPESTFMIVANRTEWANANKDVIVRFIRALNRAGEWIHDPKNKDEAVKILADRTKSSEKIARNVFDIMMKVGAVKKTPEPRPAPLKIAMDDILEVGMLEPPLSAPEKYIDRSYWEEAMKK